MIPREPNGVDRWRQSTPGLLPQYSIPVQRSLTYLDGQATVTARPPAARPVPVMPGQVNQSGPLAGIEAPAFFNFGGALESSIPGLGLLADIGRIGQTTGMVEGQQQPVTLPGALGSVPGANQAASALGGTTMAALAGWDLSYRVFNTSVGGTLMGAATAFDAFNRATNPNWVGISANSHLNDGFQYTDIINNYTEFWTQGITAGQAIASIAGRAINKPFMGKEKDATIIADLEANWADPGNTRQLYSYNIGLHSEFDFFNEHQRESAFNQGWGRWISGASDAAVSWFFAPEVIGMKVATKVATRSRNLFTQAADALTDAGIADDLFSKGVAYEAARAEGQTLDQVAAQGLSRPAYYQLTESLARLNAKQILRHDIARQSSDPAFVAKVLGDAVTPEQVHQRLKALAGNVEAIQAIKADGAALHDAMLLRSEHQLAASRMLETPVAATDDIFTRVMYGPTLKMHQDEIARLDEVIANAREVNPELDTLLRGFDNQADVTLTTPLQNIPGGPRSSIGRIEKMERQAIARADRVAGRNMWTTSVFHSMGGGVGRTIRVIHSAGNYARTLKVNGWVKFNDQKMMVDEITAAVTTNPVLRRAAKLADQTPFAKYGDGSAWLPTTQKALEKLRIEAPAEYQKLIDDPDAWAAWAAKNKAMTAIQFRDAVIDGILRADTDIKRFGLVGSFEERLFKEMAEYYGHSQDEMLELLARHNELRNNLVEQIGQRGWFKDPDGWINMLPELQSEVASGAPLMDFIFMDRVLRMERGGLSGAGARVSMGSAQALSKFDSLWRPLVLLRIGYTLRNVTEGQLRELAYFNTMPGAKAAGRRGGTQLTDAERAMLNWASGSRSYGVDLLERVGRRLGWKPWRSDKRLRAQYRAEQQVLRQMRSAIDGKDAEITRLLERRARRYEAATRVAQRRAAEARVLARQPYESVVWQRIEEGAELNLDQLRMMADEIIIEPSLVEGAFIGRYADDLGSDLTPEAAAATRTMQDAFNAIPADDPKVAWVNWLAPEKQQEALAAIDRVAMAGVGGGDGTVASLAKEAVDNFLASKQGRGGLLVVRTYEDTYRIVRDGDDFLNAAGWGKYDEAALNSLGDLGFVPPSAVKQLQAARANVYGGTYDARAVSLAGNNPLEPYMETTDYDDLFLRIFFPTSDYNPASHFSNVPFIGDSVGGMGRNNSAVGYVQASFLHGLRDPNVPTSAAYGGYEEQYLDDLAEAIANGTLDRPVVVGVWDAGGQGKVDVQVIEGDDIVAAANLSTRQWPEGITRGYTPQIPVTLRKMPGLKPDARDTFEFRKPFGGRMATSDQGAHPAPGYAFRDPRLQHLHPAYLFADQTFFPIRNSGTSFLDSAVNDYPQFEYMLQYVNGLGYDGLRLGARALPMIELSRVFAAARLDDTIRQQLTLRANWNVLPSEFRRFIQDKGYLMPDDMFTDLVNTVAPPESMTQDQLFDGLNALRTYQDGSSDLNNALGTGAGISPDKVAMIGMLDGMILNSSRVGDDGLRVHYTLASYDERARQLQDIMDDGGEVSFRNYTSVHNAAVGETGLDLKVGYGGGYTVAFDLAPGTPYASLERMVGDSWETERVLPRGMTFRFKGVEPSYTMDGRVGADVRVYEAYWDEAAATVNPEPARTGQFRVNLPTSFSFHDGELGTRLGDALSDGGSGMFGSGLGGFWDIRFGPNAGGVHYVKEYQDNAQAVAELFADTLYKATGAKIRGNAILLQSDDSLLYATKEAKVGERWGDFVSRRGEGDEVVMDLAQSYFDNYATDVFLANWDTPGMPSQGMTNLEVLDDGYGELFLSRVDNGSAFMYRGMSGQKFNGDMDAMVTQGARDMLDNNDGLQELMRVSGLDPDRILDRYTYSLSHLASSLISDGGPRAVLERMYRALLNGYGGPNTQRLLAGVQAQADQMAELAERRLLHLLDEAIEEGWASNPQIRKQLAAQRDRLRRVMDGTSDQLAPAPRLNSGPIDVAARELDDPRLMFDQEYLQTIALDFANQTGRGKIIIPDPSNVHGRRVLVNNSHVDVSNDLIDAARPGFMVDAARSEATVIDLANDPDEIMSALGIWDVANSVRIGRELSEADKLKIAIAMENSGYLTHVALPDGSILSASELVGNADTGAAFGAAVAPDLVQQYTARILDGDPHYSRWTRELEEAQSSRNMLQTRFDEQEAVVRERLAAIEKRMTSREQAGGLVRRGGQRGELLRTPEGRAVVAPGPLSTAEEGSFWMEEASSASRVASDIGGLADATNRSLRRRTMSGTAITPDSDMYWAELALYGNRRFRNDPVAEAIMRGDSDEQIMEMLFNTNRGRAALRDSEDWKMFRGLVSRDALVNGLDEQMRQEILRRREVLDQFFPDQQVRDAMMNGQLTEDFLRVRLGHRTDLPEFDGGSWEYIDSGYRKMIGKAMHALGTVPEDRMVRHPFFRNRWRESMQYQLGVYEAQGVTQFTPEMIKTMSFAAKKYARQSVNDTLYTIKHVSTPAMAIRFLVPFFPAWASAARFWFKQVPMKHPENIIRYAMISEAPKRAGWVVDPTTGEEVEGADSAPMAVYNKLFGGQRGAISFQIPQSEYDWLNSAVSNGLGTVNVSLGSIDMLLQGDFPLLPDAHPFVTVPVQWLAAQRPDLVTEVSKSLNIEGGSFTVNFMGYDHEINVKDIELGRLLSGKVIGFNDLTNEKDIISIAADMALPSGAAKFLVAMRGMSSPEYVATAQELLRNRQYEWALADPDTRGPEPTLQQAINDAGEFWKFRGWLALGLPFSASFQATNQFLIDSWHAHEEAGRAAGQTYDEYLQSYLDLYGEDALAFTKSKSGSPASSMGADLGEYEFVIAHEELAGKMASLGPQNSADYLGMLTRPFATGEFDPNVWSWQMNRNIPGTVGKVFRGGAPESLQDSIMVDKGWREYENHVAELDAFLAAGAIPQEMYDGAKKMMVNDLASRNRQWFEKYKAFNGGKWVTAITGVNTMLSDPGFRSEFAPPAGMAYEDMNRGQQYYYTLDQFVQARNWAIGMLQQAAANGGSDNINAKANAPIAGAYNMALQDLYMLNMDFRDMHQRYFASDEVRPYEGTVQ